MIGVYFFMGGPRFVYTMKSNKYLKIFDHNIMIKWTRKSREGKQVDDL